MRNMTLETTRANPALRRPRAPLSSFPRAPLVIPAQHVPVKTGSGNPEEMGAHLSELGL